MIEDGEVLHPCPEDECEGGFSPKPQTDRAGVEFTDYESTCEHEVFECSACGWLRTAEQCATKWMETEHGDKVQVIICVGCIENHHSHKLGGVE